MSEKLTPQQKEAVFNRGGNLLVSAAAGSGKTKVLVDRLMTYIKDDTQPADLDEFLIITYTKAAASELRGKIAAKLTEAVAGEPDNRHLQQQLQRLYLTKISTVHAFCGELLREYSYRLDICGDFRVADETECADLQLRVIDELLENAYSAVDTDPYFRAFADTQGLGRDDRQLPELIQKVYNSARCHLDPEGWLDWCLSAGDPEEIHDAADTVWGVYLKNELRQYLALQIDAFHGCISRASAADGMDKPLALLQDTLFQLERLKAAESWDSIRKAFHIDFGRLVFSKKCSDPTLAEQIKAVRNACKKGIEKRLRWFADDSDRIVGDMHTAADATRGLVSLVKEFIKAYSRVKRSRRILDFGDLEHYTLDLLLGKKRSGPTTIAAEVGSRFREVMVDEYQDSNAVQDAIFSAITSGRNNCFMVGDVKQSIYQFRLADPDIFLDKYRCYASVDEAGAGQGRKVMLTSNFRSAASVISAVNDVFTACMSKTVGGLDYGADEALYEGLPHEEIDEAEIELYGLRIREDTYAEEAAFTAERICQLLDGNHMVRGTSGLRPIIPDDIVILLRSPGSVGSQFQRALEQRGIPCTMGSASDLLQTEEISVLYAFLQIINNPLQDIPMLAVLTSRLFCFTADDLAEFRKGSKKADIYSALKASDLKKAVEFLELLTDLRSIARMQKLTEIISNLYMRARIDSIYSAIPDGELRMENLQAFYALAATAEANGVSDLPRFLDQLAMSSHSGLTVQADERREGSVTIMSIHKSKGLEFPVVFLCGLSREFNRDALRAAVLCDKELGIGLSCVDLEKRIRYPSLIKTAIAARMQRESLSEEMRVLYVAMTRARDRLVMTYASRNLEKELTDIAMRMEAGSAAHLTGEADCPGYWILLAALQRTEAGAFFELSGALSGAAVKDHPWLIRVAEATAIDGGTQEVQEVRQLSPDTVDKLRDSLSYEYPNLQATGIPSKQTATQLKGRQKDIEAAEHTFEQEAFSRSWRKPSFIGKKVQGKELGNAVHTVMQHIRYDVCVDLEGVEQEITRIVDRGYITEEYASYIDREKILSFFQSTLGQKLRSSQDILREFKFSILVDADAHDQALAGEKILLQGVVDCALLEKDGITVIDFKSDRINAGDAPRAAEKYRNQIEVYAKALSRIYGIPVKAKLLYFLSAGVFCAL